MTIGMRLTKQGSNLLAKGMLGKEIHFSRCALGSGEFNYNTEQVWDLTEMRKFEMTLPIEQLNIIGDGSVKIVAHSTNTDVYDSFFAREHAVFAIDPDNGEEILYSYCNVANEYSTILNNNSPAVQDIKFSYVTLIRDAENVTATLDLSFAYTSNSDFEDHINSEHPHPNTPNHLSDVTSTSRIWATDEDNHLHQISIDNLKNLLERVQNDVTDEDAVIESFAELAAVSAKAELGLDANLLIFDDCEDDEVTDNFKVKVTSSAENGTLLGLESINGLKIGAYYTISDGYNQEVVQLKSLKYNVSGIHAVLNQRLSNSYDWNNTYLYRSTNAGADRKVLTWQPAEGFGGVSANIQRTLTLATNVENAQDFSISGDGVLTIDNFFTLAR